MGHVLSLALVSDSALVTHMQPFSFSPGTMVTDPGTELHATPGCLHLRLDALSQGKNRVVSSFRRGFSEEAFTRDWDF